MHKKALVVSFVLLTLGAMAVFTLADRVNIEEDDCASIVYRYANEDVETTLSNSDSDIIKSLFQGKILRHDSPACGFSNNVSISFDSGSLRFCPACDGCGIIYLESLNKYFSISHDDAETLHSILSKYGFNFPCV